MKYFGEKSLSSFMGGFLHVSWYVVLIGAVVAPIFMVAIIVFSTPSGDSFITAIEKGEMHICDKEYKYPPRDIRKNMGKDFSSEDKDWQEFKNLPLPVKLIILPYCEAVLILLLFIIKKSHHLFINFKKDVVFNKNNVELITRISKLLIAFSIITFSFSSLLLSVVVLMLCEIFRSGTALQEEHDLTV